MKSLLISSLSILILVYTGFGLLLYLRQNSFVYFPTPEQNHAGVESTQFQINGEVLNGFVLNPGQSSATLYFGGNSEEIGFNAPIYGPALSHTSVYLLNYRGYGGSSGEPSETALFADALGLYDLLKKQHQNISVIGRSLGSGVAAHLAAHRAIDKLILVTPYDSIEHLAQDNYPFYPITLMLKDKYQTIDIVDEIEAPTLILIAAQDELIAPSYSHRLAAAFPAKQIQVETLHGAEHGNIPDHPQFQPLVRRFFQP